MGKVTERNGRVNCHPPLNVVLHCNGSGVSFCLLLGFIASPGAQYTGIFSTKPPPHALKTRGYCIAAAYSRICRRPPRLGSRYACFPPFSIPLLPLLSPLYSALPFFPCRSKHEESLRQICLLGFLPQLSSPPIADFSQKRHLKLQNFTPISHQSDKRLSTFTGKGDTKYTTTTTTTFDKNENNLPIFLSHLYHQISHWRQQLAFIFSGNSKLVTGSYFRR